MKNLTVKQLTIIRNAIIAFSMAGGLLAWFFLPAVIKNSSAVHVGNGPYGLKIGALLVLLLPLFALIPNSQLEEIHTDNPEERSRLEYERNIANRKFQIMIALLELFVICLVYALWITHAL